MHHCELADVSLKSNSVATLNFASLGSAAKSGSLHDVYILHCYACIPLMLVIYQLYILYEFINNEFKCVHDLMVRYPFSLSVLCKVAECSRNPQLKRRQRARSKAY